MRRGPGWTPWCCSTRPRPAGSRPPVAVFVSLWICICISSTAILSLPIPRIPESLNFLDVQFQRAKPFLTECVNCFRYKKRSLLFSEQKVCVNHFRDKKVYVNQGFFRIIENFPIHPDYLETFQAIQKFSRSLEIFQAISKLSRQQETSQCNLKSFAENIQTIQQLSRLSPNFPGYLSKNFPIHPETFQTIWKLSRLSGNFPDCWKFSRLFRNFPDNGKLPDAI